MARPLNTLIAGLVVLTGAWLAGWPDWPLTIIASLSGALLIAWANVDNDILDSETDRVAHPERPVANGGIDPRKAWIFSWFLLIPAMALAAFLPPLSILVFLAAMLITASYNRVLKRLPLVSNLAVSLAAALGFLFGGFLGRGISGPGWAFVLAFCYHIAREAVKSLQDMDADRVSGRRTIPVAWGERAGLVLATVFACLMVALTPLPFIFGHLGIFYLVTVLVLVDGVWIWLIVYLWVRRNYGVVSLVAKIDMLAALLALVLGRL